MLKRSSTWLTCVSPALPDLVIMQRPRDLPAQFREDRTLASSQSILNCCRRLAGWRRHLLLRRDVVTLKELRHVARTGRRHE